LLTRSFSYSVLLTYLPIPTEFLLSQEQTSASNATSGSGVRQRLFTPV
jgi:hypothetical protein